MSSAAATTATTTFTRRRQIDLRDDIVTTADDNNDDDVLLQHQLARESRQYAKQRRLLQWTELAPWQQHGSELILSGYREASGSVAACIHSWTYLHNESVNILSHVAGAVTFAYLTASLSLDAWPWNRHGGTSGSPPDRLAGAAYLAGVTVCFTLSTIFHSLLSHSSQYAARGMALDIAGILVLMAGATVPLIHFGLACGPPPLRWAFHTGTAILGAACAAVAAAAAGKAKDADSQPTGIVAHVVASVQGPAHGHRRAALFSGFAAVSFAGPLVWMIFVAADPDWQRRVDLWPGVLGTLFFNTVGFVAYMLRFPEQHWPRRFDLVGASHQIMHVAVLAAAVVYAVGVDRVLAFRRGEGAVCRDPKLAF